MKNESADKSALDAAYGCLGRRPHSRTELKKKLDREGFTSIVVESTLDELSRLGYLNDEEIALRWAQTRVRDRLWGKAKIGGFLAQKGIDRNIIDKVQCSLWQQFSEVEVGRKAFAKHFLSRQEHPPQGKVAAFLKSRGFSSEVIYRIVHELKTVNGK